MRSVRKSLAATTGVHGAFSGKQKEGTGAPPAPDSTERESLDEIEQRSRLGEDESDVIGRGERVVRIY